MSLNNYLSGANRQMKDEDEKWRQLSIWLNNPRIGMKYASLKHTDEGYWVYALSPEEKLDMEHRTFWLTAIAALLFIIVSMLL
jgi:hypothetical protein